MTFHSRDFHDPESAARIAAARKHQGAPKYDAEFEHRAYRALERFYEDQSGPAPVHTFQSTPADDSTDWTEDEVSAAAFLDEDEDELSEAPQGREYGSKRLQIAPMPGESWEGAIALLEQAKPGARRDMFLGWLELWRDRSAAKSREKYQQEGDYRERRKLIREAKREETRIKENAVKKEKYHAGQAAKGKTSRRNKDLSGMTAEEVAQHKRDQAAERQRRRRQREQSAA